MNEEIKVLPKVVGDFTSKEIVTAESLRQLAEKEIQSLDAEDFLMQVEEGDIHASDCVIVYYDYLEGGIGSTSVQLLAERERDGHVSFIYSICSELEGDCVYDVDFPLGKEVDVLQALHQRLQKKHKRI